MTAHGILWLRRDLRVSDHPALVAAMAACDTVSALYVAETDSALRPMGAATRAWVAQSLKTLALALAERGIALDVVEGHSAELVPEAVRRHGAKRVFWSRRYGPKERAHDAAIEAALEKQGVAIRAFNAGLLVEPWDIATKAGGSYGVFTPFWTQLRGRELDRPVRAPARRKPIDGRPGVAFGAQADWEKKVLSYWQPGEAGAHAALRRFLDSRLRQYPEGRDVPARDHTSALSPYLAHGEISPRQIWFATQHAMADDHSLSAAGEKFLSELAWREFSYHLLYHRDDITSVPMQPKFAGLRWRGDAAALDAWEHGQTGIPIIDAGMRQLWEMGWMHNRVRMLVASLLAKNLLIDWRKGEDWFWDTLVDADPANNPASWQWVAGSGADAAPYFRIFNPATQGGRFDAEGEYVRRWVPELAALPSSAIHAPWAAKPDVLAAAGIVLGETYPAPIVDLKASRARALDAFRAL